MSPTIKFEIIVVYYSEVHLKETDALVLSFNDNKMFHQYIYIM